MAEEPCFIVAVPPPACIRVGIMASAGVPVWTVPAAGRKMPAIRGGMGNGSCAVTGQSKAPGINQSEADRRKHGKQGKERLQGSFGIVRSRASA